MIPSSVLLRILWLAAWLGALLAVPQAARAADDFLDPIKAFAASARAADERTVELRFDIADGYYLYREQLRFSAEGGTLGALQVPAGKVKFDDTFQKNVETHRGALVLRLPVQDTVPGRPLQLTVVSQGCADKGLCYPPMATLVEARLAAFGGDGTVRVTATGDMPSAAASAGQPAPAPAAAAGEAAGLDAALHSGKFWTVVGVFLVAGLLLSLTPCVLPMLPILSSIIVGQGGATRGRGLLLAASYSLGMALLYTALGVAAGLAGEGLAATLQKPWVLTLFALALAAMALSMFDVYELRLPSVLVNRLNATSQRLPAGQVTGVFAMGGLSALIVSPCVTAPLAGALVFIGQSRDVLLGGSALFALAAGMSVPLLLLGASAGAWLPRSGPWMTAVKRFFGLLLLGVAVWIAWPVLQTSPLARLWAPAAAGSEAQALAFQPVRSLAELDQALKTSGRPVMLDFYADWCVSCKEMERFTFSDARVRERLAGALLLKADVTDNNAEHRELLKRFHLFGPPGTIFFDPQGREIEGVRVIGFQKAEVFLTTLQAAGL